MVFTKFVEKGRLVYLNYGKLTGHTAIIVDIVNTNTVLIEGATVRRQEFPVRRLTLTEVVVPVGESIKSTDLRRLWTSAKVEDQWHNTAVYKRLHKRQIRANLTDFDRFKVKQLKQRRSALVAKL